MQRFHFIVLTGALACASAGSLAVAQDYDAEEHDHAGETAEEHALHADEHDEYGLHEQHDHPAHHVSLSAIWADPKFRAALLSFLLLIALLSWGTRKGIARSLKKRRRLIEEQLEEAAMVKAEAEAKAEEYASRLARLDDEIKQIRDEMMAAAETERKRIVAEAQASAERIRRDTEFQIKQRIKQLREDLTRESVTAAIGAAERMLRETTGEADQKRLAETYLKDVADAAQREERA